MRYYLLLALLVTTLANGVVAAPVDRIGGPDGTTQTIHHCGYLPTLNAVYTEGHVTTRIVQEKLAQLGFYRGAIDGLNGPLTKAAVRAFQTEYGLGADGVVGLQTVQRLAYWTNPSPNVQRCWRLAEGF